jgi:hypothetical protein
MTRFAHKPLQNVAQPPSAVKTARHRRGRRCHTSRRRGIVLILVTVVIIMVTLAGLSFVLTLGTEHKAVDVHGDELRLQQLLESGVELMATLAEQSPELRQAAGGVQDNADLFRGALVIDDERAARHGRVTVVSPRLDRDEAVGVRYGWDDESTRLNLAVLPQWEKQSPDAARRALMCLPGMTDSAAAKILDWLDADDSPRPGGAERQQYADLHKPYAPRNGCPARIEELLLIPDVPRNLLLGPDFNREYQLASRETGPAAQNRSAGTPPPWTTLLTLYSAERNVNPQGQPRISLNDPDLRRLFTRLTAVVDPAWAEFIILYRQFGPVAGLAASPGNKPAAGGSGRKPEEIAGTLDFGRPGRVRIESILDLIGVSIALSNPPSPPWRIVESPFSTDRVALRDSLPVLLDQTTVVEDAVIRGRVNINAAPRTVLRGVPGMDDHVVEAILANRHMTGDDPARRHPIWLLTEGLVDVAQMKALLPYVTCGGQVYRAQIIGYFEEGGPMARAEVVVDATVTPPRPVSWTDLRLHGRGPSREEL